MARAFDDASNQNLSYAGAVVDGTPPFSVSCWFNSDDITIHQPLVSISDGAAGNFIELAARGDIGGDPVRFAVRGAAGASNAANTTTGYSSGTWHHALGTCASLSDLDVYIDGGSSANGSTTTPALSGLDLTTIASRFDSPTVWLSGSMAENAIWSAELTPAEAAILALGYSPLMVRPQSLVAYWPLIGRNSPEMDRVGGFDMTLNAAPTTAVHPRVIYPSLAQQLFTPSAAAAQVVGPFPTHFRV